jgi:hypothetical protein
LGTSFGGSHTAWTQSGGCRSVRPQLPQSTRSSGSRVAWPEQPYSTECASSCPLAGDPRPCTLASTRLGHGTDLACDLEIVATAPIWNADVPTNATITRARETFRVGETVQVRDRPGMVDRASAG